MCLPFLTKTVLLVRHGFRDWRMACTIYGKILSKGDFPPETVLSSLSSVHDLTYFPSVQYLSCELPPDADMLSENEEFGEKSSEQLALECAVSARAVDPIVLAARLFNYWCAKEAVARRAADDFFTWNAGKDHYGKLLRLVAEDAEHSVASRRPEFASALRVFSRWYDLPHPVTGMFAILSDWISPRGVIRGALHRAWCHAQVLAEMFDLQTGFPFRTFETYHEKGAAYRNITEDLESLERCRKA